MKKYMLKRIAFSIFSLLVVVMVVMLLVYNLTNRKVIFQTDDAWNKRNLNEKTYYEYTMYQKYGYLNFVNFTDFLGRKYSSEFGEGYAQSDAFKADQKIIQQPEKYLSNPAVQEFVKEYEGKGYKITYLEPITFKNGKQKPGGKGYLLAVKERNPLLRMVDYMKGLFTVETKNMVKDETLTDRYIRVEKDPYSKLFAVVGSGTQHKYLLYFDGRFPFIHQNFLHLNLGTSFTAYRGQEISTVITTPVGTPYKSMQVFPAKLATGEKEETALDFHTLRYNPAELTQWDMEHFPDKYTVGSYRIRALSMIENSFVIGIIASIIAYLVGVPLGIFLALKKDTIWDKLGNVYIIFIMAVPALAYIFMLAAFATTTFHLPYKFATAAIPLLGYILPVISLSLRDIGGLMKWMRRYMIDQMNSDYVKFARSQGLSEWEIFSKHISRNALIPLVHGIPGTILGAMVGVIITERVYAVPGVGNLLTNAINTHDNGIIIACTVFYTTLSIVSIILGDLLLAKYDPRISLNKDKGGGR